MLLKNVPHDTLICIFETGEYMRYIGQSNNRFLLEKETGEHLTFDRAKVELLSCMPIRDTDLIIEFEQNNALAYALNYALEAAEQKLCLEPEDSPEFLNALSVMDTIDAQLDHLYERIEKRRLGPEAAQEFLHDLTQYFGKTGAVFMGHDVKRLLCEIAYIDGNPYTMAEAKNFLAAAEKRQKTSALSKLLAASNPQTKAAESRSQKEKKHEFILE